MDKNHVSDLIINIHPQHRPSPENPLRIELGQIQDHDEKDNMEEIENKKKLSNGKSEKHLTRIRGETPKRIEEAKIEEIRSMSIDPNLKSNSFEQIDKSHIGQSQRETEKKLASQRNELEIKERLSRNTIPGLNTSQLKLQGLPSESRNHQNRESVLQRDSFSMKNDSRKKKAVFPNDNDDEISENVIALDKPTGEENVTKLVKILKNHYTFSRLQSDEM
jgi:hypothetical protein